MKKDNVVFFGTSDFAVPILQTLIDSRYRISAVITQPDKPQGRKLVKTPSPVKTLAIKNKILVLQPEKLCLADINKLDARIGVLVAY